MCGMVRVRDRHAGCGLVARTLTPSQASAAQSPHTGAAMACAKFHARCALRGVRRCHGTNRGRPRRIAVGSIQESPCIASAFSCFVHSSVDTADFPHPAPAVAMLHIHDLGLGPVKVIGNEGYLLVQLIEGVAYNPPKVGRSISKACRHCGHVAVMRP